MNIKSVVLLILDGWGQGKSWGGNAITIARIPNYNKILREYPHTIIAAAGQSVGLPGNEVGNSEVGHMNIGAGRVVKQDISQINESIKDGSFYANKVLVDSIKSSIEKNKSVHLIGIISEGGIHSHIVHLFALIKLCKQLNAKDVFIHAITDGRDTAQLDGLEYTNQIEKLTKGLGVGKIATISGRIFLDRKNDWSRTEKIYRVIAEGQGNNEKTPLSAISAAYKRGETDEFINPMTLEGVDGRVKDGDTIIFYNFRSDRTRQLTRAFLDKNFHDFKRDFIENIDFISFIPYGIEKELGVTAKTAFPALRIENTIGKFIAQNNLKQFHIAETEKYAHVTYFLNGNIEEPYTGEDRMIIPSPPVKTYDEKPEMSAEEVKDNLIKNIKRDNYSFLVCNFANPDMVGHSGNFDAAVKAVEFLDIKIKEIADCCVDRSIPLVITADHGNVEQMVDPLTGRPDPEHTKNPVPFIILSENKQFRLKEGKILGNIAETCVSLIGLSSNGIFLENLVEK